MGLNHVRRGSGEPLVLLHPLGGELVVWEPVLDGLARERDVIAPDMPGARSLSCCAAAATSRPGTTPELVTKVLLEGSARGALDRLSA
jgi:pimeloyl-ACP methyl ester carboxylesterase